jgi:hypothetical protein
MIYSKEFIVFLQTPINERIKNLVKLLRSLHPVNDKDIIENICNKELNFIKTKYPNLNTRQNYLSQYRKELIKIFPKKIKDNITGRLIFKHPALQIFTLTRTELSRIKKTSHLNRSRKGKNIARFDLREFIEKCRKALVSENPYMIATGLLGLTGRRPIEILKTAHFKQYNYKKHHIHFKGQAKTGDMKRANRYYPIPILDTPDNIIHSLNLLRSKLDLKDIDNRVINRKFEYYLGKISKTLLENVIASNYVGLTSKSYRSMYASSCYILFNVKTKENDFEYYAKILGHSGYENHSPINYTFYKAIDDNLEKFTDLLPK